MSSTIADLTEERRAVLDWLRLARHQAVDSYLPDSDTVRDSCLDDVAACDLYVLILGHRYGFQPPEDNPEGLSITQLEFRRAGECGIPRVALLRTSIPDVRLSDLQDPARAPLVLAFRDEVAGQVRPAEFSDLQGLIQGLSTGIQGELDKLGKRSAGQVAAGRVLRLAPRPVFLAGREELLAELEARLAGDDGAGPRVVALCGLGGAGKTSVALEYAHRQLGEVGVAWQLPAEDPAVLAAGFGELAAQLGAADRGDPVAAVHGVLAASPAPWLLVFDNAPDRASVAPVRAAGRARAGADHQPEPDLAARPGPGRAGAGPAGGRGVPGQPDRRRGPAGGPGAGRGAGRAAAGAGAGRRLRPGQRGQPGRVPGLVPAAARGPAGPRRADRVPRDGGHHLEAGVRATWSRPRRARPGCCGCWRSARPRRSRCGLLLQPRPGWPGSSARRWRRCWRRCWRTRWRPGTRSRRCAGIRWSRPAADGSVSVHRLVQAVTADQMPAELAEAWRQAAAALIEAAIPDDTALPGTWPVCAALLPHAQAALADDSDGMARIANYLGSSGSYAAARDLQRRVR